MGIEDVIDRLRQQYHRRGQYRGRQAVVPGGSGAEEARQQQHRQRLRQGVERHLRCAIQRKVTVATRQLPPWGAPIPADQTITKPLICPPKQQGVEPTGGGGDKHQRHPDGMQHTAGHLGQVEDQRMDHRDFRRHGEPLAPNQPLLHYLLHGRQQHGHRQQPDQHGGKPRIEMPIQ